MLVISRYEEQRIFIGRDREVEILVMRARGGRARIGISAPADIPVVRDDAVRVARRRPCELDQQDAANS